jgi:hypothetical protein
MPGVLRFLVPFFLAAILFLPTAAVPVYSQTQVTLGSSKDNTLYESAGGLLSNGAGQHFFAGRTNQLSGSIRRGLIAFDIAGAIPVGATILSVSLTLNMTQQPAPGGGPEVITLHKVLADWGEGTSIAAGNEGGGASASAGDATWLHRTFNTSLWGTPGGDFDATASGSQTVSGVGSYTWESTPEMVADAQLWLDSPTSNFGWAVLGNESTTQTAKRFDTKEHINPDARPQLNVSYLPPVSVEEPSETPALFALFQNYPNPFNPSTTFIFDIPASPLGGQHSTFAVLKIYDLLGRDVATLVSEEKPPGTYSIAWNAEGLGSGVYFCRLEAGRFSEMRRLVLLR